MVHRLLADPPKLDEYGRPIRAPYGLRKIESGLVKAVGRENVAVVDPRRIVESITEDTEVVGLNAMDPLGLGPVSMSFTNGGSLTPYSKYMFLDLLKRIPKKNRSFKVVVGGPGAWQFDYRPGLKEQLGIDHTVQGEIDHLVGGIFERIASGEAPTAIRFENGTAPKIDEIPKILKPAMDNMVEVMRGCGRGCDFCEVTRRKLRYMPLDFISDEVAVNTTAPRGGSVQLHADDIFLYELEDKRTLTPNKDALKGLFQHVMSLPGVTHCYPTHGTVSAAAVSPDLIEDISRIVRAGPDKWIGIQCGAETGSPKLAKQALSRKAAPYSPEEWPDLVVRGAEILNRNYWFPAFTVIMGLPGETPEDAWMTVDLIDRMEQIPNNHFIIAPLTFVPAGALRGAEFYNAYEKMDEACLNVAYRAWRHDVLEMDQDLWQMLSLPGPIRAMIAGVARFGGRWVLSIMEKYATRKGFKIRKPAKSVRESQGHVIASQA